MGRSSNNPLKTAIHYKKTLLFSGQQFAFFFKSRYLKKSYDSADYFLRLNTI